MLAGLRRVFAAFFPLYGLIVAAERALAFAARARERELAASRLESHLHRARLENLRAQLRPHFLFNALHAISALMGRDLRRARQMMAQLSELLRLSLEGGDEHLVALSRELETLTAYVALQELRFGDRLDVAVDVEPSVRDLPVPRILLQPLVENCIHHALERRSGSCRVGVEARRRDDRLVLRVADDGPGFGERRTEGVGLGNTRARLAALYGDAATLRTANRPTGGAEVTVELPVAAPGLRREEEVQG